MNSEFLYGLFIFQCQIRNPRMNNLINDAIIYLFQKIQLQAHVS